MINWLEENWPKSTIFLAIYATILLLLFVLQADIALFLLWIQLPIYWLHQFEEYVYPGGFLEVFNKEMLGSQEAEWPLTKKESLWINIPFIYVAFPLTAVLAGAYNVSIGLWMPYFSILNALSHIGMFARRGYNPGFWVSLLLNIPVGGVTIWYFAANDLTPAAGHLVGLLIAVLCQGGLMIWGLKFMRAKVRTRYGS